MSYEKMIDENPHLLAYEEVVVVQYYKALEWADPEVAAQPTVAASVINNLLVTSAPPSALTQHRDVFPLLWPIYMARKQREQPPR